MKLELFLNLVLLIYGLECLIFIKKLHDDAHPGKCYPVHTRVDGKEKLDVIALNPGEERADPNSCGITVCMSADGTAYVYYCPATVPSSECKQPKFMNTRLKFPECCWNCTDSMKCATDTPKN